MELSAVLTIVVSDLVIDTAGIILALLFIRLVFNSLYSCQEENKQFLTNAR